MPCHLWIASFLYKKTPNSAENQMLVKLVIAMVIPVVGFVAHFRLKNQGNIIYYFINVAVCDYKLIRLLSVNALNLKEFIAPDRCVWCGAVLGQYRVMV